MTKQDVDAMPPDQLQEVGAFPVLHDTESDTFAPAVTGEFDVFGDWLTKQLPGATVPPPACVPTYTVVPTPDPVPAELLGVTT